MLLLCYITLPIPESLTTFSVSHDCDIYITSHYTPSSKFKINEKWKTK